MEKKKKKKGRRSQFDKLAEDLTGKHSKTMNAILLTQGSMDGMENDFANNFFKLLEFVQPKLQRTEQVGEKEDNVIIIEHVTVSKDELKED